MSEFRVLVMAALIFAWPVQPVVSGSDQAPRATTVAVGQIAPQAERIQDCRYCNMTWSGYHFENCHNEICDQFDNWQVSFGELCLTPATGEEDEIARGDGRGLESGGCAHCEPEDGGCSSSPETYYVALGDTAPCDRNTCTGAGHIAALQAAVLGAILKQDVSELSRLAVENDDLVINEDRLALQIRGCRGAVVWSHHLGSELLDRIAAARRSVIMHPERRTIDTLLR